MDDLPIVVDEAALTAARKAVHAELVDLRSLIAKQLVKRIKKGDPVVDDKGEVSYRPLKGRDLSTALVQVNDVIGSLEKTKVKDDGRGKIGLDDLQMALRNLARTEIAKDNAKAIPGERLN